MTDRTCAERLPEHLQGRLDDLRLLTKAASEETLSDAERVALDSLGVDTSESENVSENARETLYDYGLSVERRTVLRWTISTGGPADGFDVTYDDEGQAVRASYWFQDWFDGAELPVDKDTMEMVSEIVNPDGIFTDLNMR
jgi:hypothetical protein